MVEALISPHPNSIPAQSGDLLCVDNLLYFMKIEVLLGNRGHPAPDTTASGETEMKNLPPGHIGSDIALAAVENQHPHQGLRAASADPC